VNHRGVAWHKKYVDIGQSVAVYPFPWIGKPFVGVVEKITRNKYGRISYVIGGKNVVAEELFPANTEKKLRVPYWKGWVK
jgi:hypothetical protein